MGEVMMSVVDASSRPFFKVLGFQIAPSPRLRSAMRAAPLR
jgi:hypothetical protein